jgi:hypothetical protein
LDVYLGEMIRVDRAQMETEDARALKRLLDEVTRIQIQALDELTHEELRDRQMFSLFLMQCSHVAGKIQNKIILNTLKSAAPPGAGDGRPPKRRHPDRAPSL